MTKLILTFLFLVSAVQIASGQHELKVPTLSPIAEITQEAALTEALEKSAKNSRYGLLRAKIIDKAGKRDEALNVVTEANAWACASNNANYTEQTQLFWDSIKK